MIDKIIKAAYEFEPSQMQLMYGVQNPTEPKLNDKVIYHLLPFFVLFVGIIVSIFMGKKNGNKKVAFIGTAITVVVSVLIYVIKSIFVN